VFALNKDHAVSVSPMTTHSKPNNDSAIRKNGNYSQGWNKGKFAFKYICINVWFILGNVSLEYI